MGRKTLMNQALHVLNSKMALGESRKEAKAQLRADLGDDYRFGITSDKIHSIRTRETYQTTVVRFVRWCVDEQGVGKYARLDDFRGLAPVYLQTRQDQGKSVWTLKMERSALGLLYGSPVVFTLAPRTPDKITWSRGSKAMDKHFSVDRNRALVTIARATGGRREDIAGMRSEDFRWIGGRLYVAITGSKGGRDRIAPVLPELEKDVKNILSRAETTGKTQLFEQIHSKADIHSYRREYAQALYRVASQDRALRDELLQVYRPRQEPRIKGSTYTTKRGTHRRTYDRDDLYLVAQALGHNRLEVAVTHYLL